MSVPTCKCPDEYFAVEAVGGENAARPGKRYYHCRYSATDEGCGFFKWADEPVKKPRCRCERHCKYCTSRKNGGRMFWACPRDREKDPKHCGYFKWADEEESSDSGGGGGGRRVIGYDAGAEVAQEDYRDLQRMFARLKEDNLIDSRNTVKKRKKRTINMPRTRNAKRQRGETASAEEESSKAPSLPPVAEEKEEVPESGRSALRDKKWGGPLRALFEAFIRMIDAADIPVFERHFFNNKAAREDFASLIVDAARREDEDGIIEDDDDENGDSSASFRSEDCSDTGDASAEDEDEDECCDSGEETPEEEESEEDEEEESETGDYTESDK